MPATRPHSVFHQLRKVIHLQQAKEATDLELLQRFATGRDETAFACLLRRHGPMVFGICRRVLRSTEDAEDAFQATFLVLIKKAAAIRQGELLANWLFGVAMRTARKALVYAAKRRVRELPLPADCLAADHDEPQPNDFWPILIDEVNRLPARHRRTFVLCNLENKSLAEAAGDLGCPVGTVKSRLASARARLRSRLTRRGLAISAGAFAVALEGLPLQAAVPAALVHTTLRGALSFAGSGLAAPVILSSQVTALTQGVLHAMFLTKLKTIGMFLSAIIVAGFAIGIASFPRAAAKNPAAPAHAVRAEIEPVQVAEEFVQKGKADEGKKKHAGKRETAEEVVTKKFTTGKSPHVIVEVINGGIQVDADGDKEVQVEVTKKVSAKNAEDSKAALKKLEIEMTQEGDTVRIVAKHPKDDKDIGYGASAKLKVPAGSKVELRSSNGPVSANGITGEARIRTSNGSIQLKGSPTMAELNSSNGGITVTGVKGQVKAHTSNGNIGIEGEKCVVSAETTNGKVSFKGSLADGAQTFHSSNGSIAIALPAGARFTVDAQTSLGHVTSQFPIQPAPKAGRSTTLKGSTGGTPAISLKLRTTNGSIELRETK